MHNLSLRSSKKQQQHTVLYWDQLDSFLFLYSKITVRFAHKVPISSHLRNAAAASLGDLEWFSLIYFYKIKFISFFCLNLLFIFFIFIFYIFFNFISFFYLNLLFIFLIFIFYIFFFMFYIFFYFLYFLYFIF